MSRSIFLYATMFTVLFLITLPVFNQTKKLEYKVDVSGKSVNFRVLNKGKMVDYLNKSDFRLFYAGKEIEIESFTKENKKISIESNHSVKRRRMFVIVINLSDHRLDMKENLGYFFDNILRKGDRIIFISNSFFLNDRIVVDKKAIRTKIEKLLKIERTKIRYKKTRIKTYLSRVLREAVAYIKAEKILLGRRYFVENFLKYLDEFKQNYLDLDTSQYIKLTEYLADLKMDKWVLGFYHIAGFYRPGKNVDLLVHKDPLYSDLQKKLEVVHKLPERDLSKFFIKSGATLHSIFMKNSELSPITYHTGRFLILPDVSDGTTYQEGGEVYSFSLQYNKIASNSENFISLATQMSGGLEFSSRKTEKFFKKITTVEDIMYTITFDTPKKGEKIKLVPKNNDYKILFNDQNVSEYMKRQLENQKEKTAKIPQVQIDKIGYKNGRLNVKIVNFQMVKESNTFRAELDIHLKIVKSEKTVLSKKRMFNCFESDFDLNIRLPKLKKGMTIIVDVKDRLTDRNDIAVYEI